MRHINDDTTLDFKPSTKLNIKAYGKEDILSLKTPNERPFVSIKEKFIIPTKQNPLKEIVPNFDREKLLPKNDENLKKLLEENRNTGGRTFPTDTGGRTLPPDTGGGTFPTDTGGGPDKKNFSEEKPKELVPTKNLIQKCTVMIKKNMKVVIIGAFVLLLLIIFYNKNK